MKRNFAEIFAAFLMCAILIAVFAGIAPQKTTLTFASGEKAVYLTFDDGPSDRITPKILDVLKKEDVKATFFIVGKSAVLRKNILRRMSREGHTLGVHSYSHAYNEIYSSRASLLNDIEKCNAVIKEITGKDAEVYRFPGGSHWVKENLKDAVKNLGLRYVDWNASFGDADLKNPTAQVLYENAVASSAGKGSVILLAHDTTDKTSTVEALGDIIKYYKNNGYTFKKL